MRVEVVDSLEGLLALRPEYERLNEASKNLLPFALHTWHVAWWRHLARSTPTLRDDLFFQVARDERDRCVGIVPLVMTTRGVNKWGIRTLDFLGPDQNLTEIRGPLVLPGREAGVAWAVRRSLALRTDWDWIHWSGIDGAFGEALAVAGPLAWNEPTLDYIMPLPATWEAFRSELKRNVRESLRHCYNSLKREGIDFTFEVAQTPDEVRAALVPFLALHSMRAQLGGTVTHPERFPDTFSRDFLCDVCTRLAGEGIAKVFLLGIRGEVVAARIGFLVRDSLYLYYSGFDPKWAKYGVMTTTLAETFKYAIASKVTTVNLSTGTDVSKTRWPVRTVELRRADERNPRLRSRLAFRAYRQMAAADPPAWSVPFLSLLRRRDEGPPR